MLVTDVRDQMCWWLTWYIKKITNITKKVANIMIRPSKSEVSHHHKVANITMSPTQLCHQYHSILNFNFELFYRGGLTMFARKVMLRTRHACHIQNKRDQVCLPYKFFCGLDMLAISFMIGTMYACNVHKKGDQTCLPYHFCSGPGMPAIFSGRD